ncbi:MAG: MEKHLA domain-containing protein [Planctomycetia bacterium]|nr:MEKHLA domain-containing protein [Planctomycetia bacterium]
MPAPVPVPPRQPETSAGRSRVILDSFRRLLGRELIDRSRDDHDDDRRLRELPLAVLAHDTSSPARLDWVNAAAAAAFDATPEALLGLPSASTAPPDAAADRERLFGTLRREGFVTGYSGVRVSLTGRRFLIEDVTVIELHDATGRPAGHAAIIGKTRPEASAGRETFQTPPRTVP